MSRLAMAKEMSPVIDGDKKGFFEAMTDNQFFSAGVGVAGIGLGLTVFRRALLSGVIMAQRYFTTSLEIPSKDRSYQWVLQWINSRGQGRTQHLGVETRVINHDNGSHTTSFEFVPSPGRHFLWYKGNLVQVEREREKSMIDLNSGSPWETVKLTIIGRKPYIFTELLKDAKNLAQQKEQGKTVVYMPQMTEWRPFGRPRAKRALTSVYLDDGLAEMLIDDINEFHRASAWYAQRGIPHRRGYLLYGPPGSGKSSFIQALAGALSHNICVLNLNDRGLSDDRLLHLMTELPPRSILLLEDIDAVFNKRESTYTVTFSGLLNALDGVTSAEERLVFMTTNHVHRLDPALVRPGRIDVKAYLGHSTPFQQRSMFLQFYPDYDPVHAAQAAAAAATALTVNLHGSSSTSSRGNASSERVTSSMEAEELARQARASSAFVSGARDEDEDLPLAVFAAKLKEKFPRATETAKKVAEEASEKLIKGVGSAAEAVLGAQVSQQTTEEDLKEARLQGRDVDDSGSEAGKLADLFVEQLRGVEVSMAELQGIMLMYKNQPRAAIRAAAALRTERLARIAREKARRDEEREKAKVAAAAAAAAAASGNGDKTGTGLSGNKPTLAGVDYQSGMEGETFDYTDNTMNTINMVIAQQKAAALKKQNESIDNIN